MASAAMDRDLEFEIGLRKDHVHLLYTPGEAWRKAAADWYWAWLVGILVLLLLSERLLLPLGASGSSFLRWTLAITGIFVLGVAILRSTLPTIPAENLVAESRSTPFRHSEPGARLLHESDDYAAKPLPEVRALLEGRLREAAVRNPYTGRPLQRGDSPGDYDLVEDFRGPVVRTWSLEGVMEEMPWFTERIEGIEGILFFRAGPFRPATVEEARSRLFPDGVFVFGLRNPFTGAPVREGRSPGDAEVLDENGSVLVRAWFREGKHEDFVLR